MLQTTRFAGFREVTNVKEMPRVLTVSSERREHSLQRGGEAVAARPVKRSVAVG
jgi:hypothetical protein